jgi:hypothetical protein
MTPCSMFSSFVCVYMVVHFVCSFVPYHCLSHDVVVGNTMFLVRSTVGSSFKLSTFPAQSERKQLWVIYVVIWAYVPGVLCERSRQTVTVSFITMQFLCCLCVFTVT